MSGGGEGTPTNTEQQAPQAQIGNFTNAQQSRNSNRYTPTYAPMQQSPQQNIQNMGLEALYQSMANQFAPISQQQNPMDQFYQGPMQQGRQIPAYGSSYKPNMSGITANLSRVAPAVTREQMNPTLPEPESVSFLPTYDSSQAG